jgi:hypothetical protein
MQPSTTESTILSFMDSTHTPMDSDAGAVERLEELAEVDPADAPAVAERLAENLADQLDASAARSMPAEQLEAEFDSTSD